MRLTKAAAVLLACATVAASPVARASPVVYSESDFLRVTIGASAQLVGTLKLMMTADTSTVFTPIAGVRANPGTVTFMFNAGVSGTFSGTITDSVQVFDNQANGLAGFTDITQSAIILDTNNAGFDSYDLTTLLSPTTGTAGVGFGLVIPTSAGTLDLLSSPQDINRSTFTTSAVPEPATLTLLTAGLMGLARIRRRRAR
jgi:hypothetical protein